MRGSGGLVDIGSGPQTNFRAKLSESLFNAHHDRVANVGAGLFFGMLRERTGSVWPGAVAHGMGGVLKLVPQV